MGGGAARQLEDASSSGVGGDGWPCTLYAFWCEAGSRGRPPASPRPIPTAAAGPAQMPACGAGGTGCSGPERTAGRDGLAPISPKTRQRFRACPSFQGGYLALNCLQVTMSKRQEGHGARAGGQHWGLRVPQDQVLTHPCPGPGQAGVMAKAARHHSRCHPHAVHVPSFPQSPRWDGRGSRTCFSWSRRRSSVTPRARMPRARHAACSSLTLRLSTPSSEISCKESPPSSEKPLEVHGAYGPHLEGTKCLIISRFAKYQTTAAKAPVPGLQGQGPSNGGRGPCRSTQ